LFAAYSVAVSANDVEYFARICKDIAQSLESEQGRIACEAQDEVLQICDQLFLGHQIIENQLLYLRHLVLVREEAVADIYDEYQDKKIDLTGFARALFDLANSQTNEGDDVEESERDDNNEDGDENEDVENEDDEEDEEEDEDEDVSEETIQLSQIVVSMIDQEILSVPEAETLVEMVRQKNEYVLAAFELFFDDKNKEELTDTLLRYCLIC